MEFSTQLLFFFSALGAFNGLIFGIYFLFFAHPRELKNKFLGMLILMLSIRVGKSVFFYFNEDLAIAYLQFGLTACFFIGPFLYFYIKSMAMPKSQISKEWKYHLMILIPIALIGGFMYPFETNIELWRCRNGIISWIYYSWMVYIVLSMYTMRESLAKIFNSSLKLNAMDIWLISMIVGNIILVTMYKTMHFTYYISGALSFSFILYLSWAYLYFNRNNRILFISDQKKYGDKSIENDEAKVFEGRLRRLMEEEQLFKDSRLKLPKVANELKTSPHRLSQYLNDNLDKSFNQYINEYRIEAAKKLIKVNDQFTLEAIGYEVGFNSRSTFYSAFKKQTGLTPAAFKKSS